MITIHRTATISLTPDEWDLYTNSKDCTEAAAALNAAAEQAIADSQDAGEAMRKFSPTMYKWRSFGAYDTEPQYVAAHLFAKVFGSFE